VATPVFKQSGMKLGSKRTKQAELLDALGGDVLATEEMSVPSTPAPSSEPVAQKDSRGSLPAVTVERYARNCSTVITAN
jgi:coatomer subunit delta